MDNDELIKHLIERCRDGDELAAARVYHLYSERLRQLAERQIGMKFKSKFDEDDVEQTVFRTLFRHLQKGDYELDSETELWALLSVITARKVLRNVKFHRADKRDVKREVILAEVIAGTLADGSSENHIGELHDIRNWVESIFGPENKQIFDDLLQGETAPDIAHSLGRSATWVRTVRRRMVEAMRKSFHDPEDS